MMFCACKCLCVVNKLELGEVCIRGWNCMLQPYIESATALSDIYVLYILTRGNLDFNDSLVRGLLHSPN